MREAAFQVISRFTQTSRLVFELPGSAVAAEAEQTADQTCVMVMIHVSRRARQAPRHPTSPSGEFIPVIRGHSVPELGYGF